MYCGKCGKQNSEGIRYCVHCGADMAKQTPLPPASTPPAETIEDTAALRRELLDASKSTGKTDKPSTGAPHKPRMISADSVGLGKTLSGRYKIGERLGVGGMGEVFKATDAELNDLSVAIKILPPILAANTRSINRLRTEAAISLKLTHPNICRLHTFRVDGDVKFLVMEHIPGQTLEEMLDATDERKLPLAKILPIAGNVADALDFAHSQNPPILHRDIKPSNVMVTPHGVGKVLDFGIARELKDSMTRMTGKDTSGTLLYMSPEQFTGSTPTAASDIYSFAAMLYECICGHAPFWQGSIAHQLLNQTPTRMRGMPDHVNDALQAGLAKNGGDRPASARELVRLLEGRDKGIGESSGGVLSPGRAGSASPPPRQARRATDGAPRGKSRPPKGKTAHPRRKRTHAVLLLLLALVGIAVVGYRQGWWSKELLARLGWGPQAKSTQTPTGPGSKGSPKTGTITLDEAIAAQQKAESSWAKVKDVSGENRFEGKLRAAQTLLVSGEEKMKQTEYARAVAMFKDVETRCKEIEQSDIKRQQAITARIGADKARSAAETTGAAKLAAALWQGAEKTGKRAAGLLEADKFTDADAAWQQAQEEYGKAAVLAVLTAKVDVARKEWDEALKATDQASLDKYGGKQWLDTRSELARAQAAGLSEDAPAMWRQATKLLAGAWKEADKQAALEKEIAGYIASAEAAIASDKYADARTEADKVLALAPKHEAATFLGGKADAGAALAKARAALKPKPVEALTAVQGALAKLKQLTAEAPSDETLKAWLDEAEKLKLQLANIYRLDKRLDGHEKAVMAVDINAGGTEFVTGSSDATVRIWDPATGKVLRTILADGEVSSAVYCLDGSRLAWAVGAKLVTVDRAENARPVTHEGHLLAILAVAFSPDGKIIISCGEDDKLLVRDAAAGKVTATLENEDDATCLAFSPDGKTVVSGSGKLLVGKDEQLVRIWDVATGKCIHKLSGHSKTVRAVAFSADGKVVASGGDSGVILIHDAATGKELARLTEHEGAVSAIRFRKDGLRLASAGADKKVRMWDPVSGKCTQTLDGHTAWVRALQFSPDGKRLISAGDDKTVIIWALGLKPAPPKPPGPTPAGIRE